MNTKWSIWYCDDAGRQVAPLTRVGTIEYVKTIGAVGFARVSIPPDDPLATEVRPDWRLHIYRQPVGGAMVMEMVAFLRRFKQSTDENGRRQMVLEGKDPNDLLDRRIVDRYAGDSFSGVDGLEADRAMQQIFDITLGALADFDHDNDPRSWARDLVELGLIRRTQNAVDGPTIEKRFAWRNALATLQDIQAQTRAMGNETFFGIVPATPTLLEFRTWVGQPGLDRTITTGTNPIIFSVESGTLSNPSLSYDYFNAKNYIFAGGRGIESDREIAEASDEARIGLSRVGRNEAFAQAARYSSSDGVQGVAQDELARKRPGVILTGDLLDTPMTPYGGPSGWNLGDRVTISHEGRQFDSLIRSVHVHVNGQGKETVRGRVEADANLIAG